MTKEQKIDQVARKHFCIETFRRDQIINVSTHTLREALEAAFDAGSTGVVIAEKVGTITM